MKNRRWVTPFAGPFFDPVAMSVAPPVAVADRRQDRWRYPVAGPFFDPVEMGVASANPHEKAGNAGELVAGTASAASRHNPPDFRGVMIQQTPDERGIEAIEANDMLAG